MRRGWRAGRSLVPCLVLVSSFCSGTEARDEVELALRSEGRRPGIAGSLRRNGVEVVFESHATASRAESRILSSTGEVLSEVLVDSAAGTFEYRVGGVTLSEQLTPEEAERVAGALAREEAALAAEHLWPALEGKGHSRRSREMAAIAANLTGYEMVGRQGPTDQLSIACLGCCGPSCWGCSGCYTRACLAHDLCVSFYGYTSPRCMGLLYLAALSAWCCQGGDLGVLC